MRNSLLKYIIILFSLSCVCFSEVPEETLIKNNRFMKNKEIVVRFFFDFKESPLYGFFYIMVKKNKYTNGAYFNIYTSKDIICQQYLKLYNWLEIIKRIRGASIKSDSIIKELEKYKKDYSFFITPRLNREIIKKSKLVFNYQISDTSKELFDNIHPPFDMLSLVVELEKFVNSL